jgi:hypothetical protein
MNASVITNIIDSGKIIKIFKNHDSTFSGKLDNNQIVCNMFDAKLFLTIESDRFTMQTSLINEECYNITSTHLSDLFEIIKEICLQECINLPDVAVKCVKIKYAIDKLWDKT